MFVRSALVSTVAVMNLPIWSPPFINSRSLARVSATANIAEVGSPIEA
jgi:hypothetical protein